MTTTSLTLGRRPDNAQTTTTDNPVWPVIQNFSTSDENVSKHLYTNGSAAAEAVLYKYPTYADRTVICCSTQSGCPVGCRFCGAGDAFVRSLTTEEIVAQPDHLLGLTGVDPAIMGRLQIMFMSMGEPLLNIKHLVPALHILYAKYPKAALLLSTSAPRVDYQPIRDISIEIPTIGLQFSVHESTDEARDALIPFKAKLTLAEIAAEGEAWAAATGRRPHFNYVVQEHNNTQADVDRLLALLDPAVWEATLSVVCERDETMTVAHDRQRAITEVFMDRMLTAGYSSRMFDPSGQNEGGGCGQLPAFQRWVAANPDRARRSAGRGLPKVHAPSAD